MWIQPAVIVLVSLFAMQRGSAQQLQPDLPTLAQAHDRCMATYAVRLTQTSATDRDIFATATQSFLALDGQLRAAIKTQLPPPQATEILRTMDAQAEPNFMGMLAKIRSDRAQRAGK